MAKDSEYNLILLEISKLRLDIGALQRERSGKSIRRPLAEDLIELFENMTAKQHAVLQFAMNGKTYGDMATALSTTENNSKAHLHAVYTKLNVVGKGPHNKRRWLELNVKPFFEGMTDTEYLRISGIPKLWWKSKEMWRKYRLVTE